LGQDLPDRVGKTTVIDAIGEVLAERGVPGAAIDLDWLRRGWPAPPDDPLNNRLERTARGAVCRVHLEAGAPVSVGAGGRAGAGRSGPSGGSPVPRSPWTGCVAAGPPRRTTPSTIVWNGRPSARSAGCTSRPGHR